MEQLSFIFILKSCKLVSKGNVVIIKAVVKDQSHQRYSSNSSSSMQMLETTRKFNT